MKAVSARAVPTGDAWSYEPKWDGHRVLVRRVGDDFDAVSSTGKPKLPQWPWLRRAVATATDHDVILDGEVVAYDDEGRHTFQSVGRADRDHAFVVFDLLALDGTDLRDRPWSERRELLESVVHPTSPLTITPVSDEADVMEAATRAQRFEGIVAKRRDSTYQSGRRAPTWVKVKYTNAQEMVVGGYKLGEGNRSGLFGSLLIGVHDDAGDLQFVSAVGTGFNERTLTTLMARLRQLETDHCPFVIHPSCLGAPTAGYDPNSSPRSGFLEWTEGGGLRAPVFLGLRDDKLPSEVVRET